MASNIEDTSVLSTFVLVQVVSIVSFESLQQFIVEQESDRQTPEALAGSIVQLTKVRYPRIVE